MQADSIEVTVTTDDELQRLFGETPPNQMASWELVGRDLRRARRKLTFSDIPCNYIELLGPPNARATARYRLDKSCCGRVIRFMLDGKPVAQAILADGDFRHRIGRVREDEAEESVVVCWQPETFSKVL